MQSRQAPAQIVGVCFLRKGEVEAVGGNCLRKDQTLSAHTRRKQPVRLRVWRGRPVWRNSFSSLRTRIT